jgi:hypothetical protein
MRQPTLFSSFHFHLEVSQHCAGRPQPTQFRAQLRLLN